MARTVTAVNISSRTARRRLKSGRQPHWNTLRAGHSHLGWQRWPEDKAGRWVLRRRIGGNYATQTIGTADDVIVADGVNTLDYEMARQRATELASGDVRPASRLTVATAMANYIERKAQLGKPTAVAR